MVTKVIKEDSAVSVRVFITVITILLTIGMATTGYFFSATAKLEAKVEATKKDCDEKITKVDVDTHKHIEQIQNQSQDVKVKLTEIQTDIIWIRRAISNEIPTRNTKGSKQNQ